MNICNICEGIDPELSNVENAWLCLHGDSGAEARFNSRVDKTLWGCWLWRGRLDRDGYGIFYLRGKSRKAHRVAYATAHAMYMPPDMVIDHVCRVRSCVNPAHMDLVTSRENNIRGSGVTSKNRKALRCKNGHLFTEETTYYSTAGRTCKPCAIARACAKVPCPECGKSLAKGGMRAHIRTQHEEKA